MEWSVVELSHVHFVSPRSEQNYFQFPMCSPIPRISKVCTCACRTDPVTPGIIPELVQAWKHHAGLATRASCLL